MKPCQVGRSWGRCPAESAPRRQNSMWPPHMRSGASHGLWPRCRDRNRAAHLFPGSARAARLTRRASLGWSNKRRRFFCRVKACGAGSTIRSRTSLRLPREQATRLRVQLDPLGSWPPRSRRPWLAGVRVAEFERRDAGPNRSSFKWDRSSFLGIGHWPPEGDTLGGGEVGCKASCEVGCRSAWGWWRRPAATAAAEHVDNRKQRPGRFLLANLTP